MLLGLTTVTGLTGQHALKGYISMVLGLMLSMAGFDIISGDARYTGGIAEMLDGVDFLPVAIGLFGMGEVLAGAEEASGGKILSARYGLRDVWPTAVDWARSRWAIVRGTVLGFVVGVLPGAGPTIASFLAYTVEKKFSRHPEEFGHGAIEGVAGPEAANNAASAGAMVPMLTLGIPGSATTAVMLGGLMMWGLRPGPLLFEKNPDFVWGLIASQYVANAMLLILNIAFIPIFVRALRLPYSILMPLIVIFCITGAYSQNNKIWDVGQMLVFGILGYGMKQLGYSPAALTLALVLGPLAERAPPTVAHPLEQRPADPLPAADLCRAHGPGAGRRGRAGHPRRARRSRPSRPARRHLRSAAAALQRWGSGGHHEIVPAPGPRSAHVRRRVRQGGRGRRGADGLRHP